MPVLTCSGGGVVVEERSASGIGTAAREMGQLAEGGWVPGVLVVDDEEDIRVLLLAVIEAANRGLAVVGQAASGEEAILRCRETNPDIVLLDQRMPGMSGLEAAEVILRERPDQQIILFSAFLEDGTIDRARALGIRACLPKGDLSLVPEALWKVAGT